MKGWCTPHLLQQPRGWHLLDPGNLIQVTLSPWTEHPSLSLRPLSLALACDPRHESLLCAHVPSSRHEAGSLNLTLSLSAPERCPRSCAQVQVGSRIPTSRALQGGRGSFTRQSTPLLAGVWGSPGLALASRKGEGRYAATGSAEKKAGGTAERRERGNSGTTEACGAGPTSP